MEWSNQKIFRFRNKGMSLLREDCLFFVARIFSALNASYN